MSEHCRIVSWFNTKEWDKVYKHIFSQQATYETKENALQTLFIWKSRCPSLPSAIESTLSLLEVHLKDRKVCEMANNQILRLSYSSAIMRFVNHMFDADTAKNNSLYQVAEKRGVPDWIVDLRHDTAHSNNLPPLELLRDACAISLQWLQDNYWNVHSTNLKDYVVTKKLVTTSMVTEEHLKAFINFSVSLSFCLNPKCKIKSLADMPLDLQQTFIQDGQEIFDEQNCFSNPKKISVNRLTNNVLSHSKNFLRKVDKALFCKLLLNNDSLFLSKEIYNLMSKKRTYKNLHKQYIKCFEFLLKLLHTNEMLQDLILALIKMTENIDNNWDQSQLAALWVSEILKALKRTQNFLHKVEKNGIFNADSRKSNEIISLFNHWFPNEKSCSLLLDLCKPVPTSLTDINFIHSIITTYNPFLYIFIKDLLELVNPGLPPAILQNICSLAKSISLPELCPAESSRIYTIDDLKTNSERENYEMASETEGQIPNKQIYEVNEGNVQQWGVWKRASDKHEWSTCPIGILPWQQSLHDVMDID